jgi:uncharacterized membrane protein YhiD involved in acid resistance
MQLAAIVISIFTLVGLLLQVHIQWRTMHADHERRKKQATIEYVNQTRAVYRPISRKLVQKFGENTVINIDQIDEETKEDITAFLSIVEHLAVGINTKVYDLQILERMSGAYFMRMFHNLQPYINETRRIRGRPNVYCEFESMVEDIKEIRGEIRKNHKGNLKF